MKDCHHLSENMLALNMLLSVFFLSGVFAEHCGGRSPTFVIETPKSIVALSGSCLQVPCSLTVKEAENDFNNGELTSAAWIPSNKYIFDISHEVNNHQIKITGNIKQRNCTTVFSDINTTQETKYFLRIEMDKFKGTACSTPLQIKVKDSPEKPRIEPDLKDLKEHQSVTVTCSAFTPCPHSPPELTWNLQQDSLRQTEKNTDGTFTTKIQETITLSDTHDGYNIRCSSRYPVIGGNKRAETEVTLSVSYAPKDTSASISPSALVSAGSWVELSCSSRAKPPPSFTWFRNSKQGATKVSVGPIYSYNATEGGEFYCVATNHLGSETSLVILVVTKGEKLLVPVTVGIIVVICFLVFLVVSVWYFMSKYSAPQKTQSQMGIDLCVQNPALEQEEELHYGEVQVTKKTPKVSLIPVQDNEQQETVYAQVKVSTPENPSTQADDSPENNYAEVKKK